MLLTVGLGIHSLFLNRIVELTMVEEAHNINIFRDWFYKLLVKMFGDENRAPVACMNSAINGVKGLVLG